MIKVKVCCGTSCYIMGSSELISTDFYDLTKVEVEGSTCMNLCKESNKRPPYVSVDGEVYSRVTPESLKKIIEEKLGAI